jgi:hypothetical protein
MTMKPNCILAVALVTLAVTSLHGQQPRASAQAPAPAPASASAPAPASAPAAAAAAAAAQPMDAPLPEVNAILDKVKSRIRLDRELQSQYTYLEKRRDVKLSKLGKVTVGALRTFEVYPSVKPGRTYKRLVEIDGKRLDAGELERRDTAHRQHLLDMVEQEKNETPQMRAKREQQEAKDLREQRELIDDAFAIFEVKLTGREMVDGHRMIAATLTPRQNVQTKSDEGKWMKRFKGRAWVSDDDWQVAKVEMEALDDISIGWGLVGRVHQGSKFTFTRTKVNGEVWLPVEMKFEASGRTLLFRKFQIFTVTSYSDYKKFNVDTSVTFDQPKTDPPQPPQSPERRPEDP